MAESPICKKKPGRKRKSDSDFPAATKKGKRREAKKSENNPL